MLNGFMLFIPWGLRKNFNEDPAGHPLGNTYRLIPFSTPVKSRRTVPFTKHSMYFLLTFGRYQQSVCFLSLKIILHPLLVLFDIHT
jgi:hypothetical protein